MNALKTTDSVLYIPSYECGVYAVNEIVMKDEADNTYIVIHDGIRDAFIGCGLSKKVNHSFEWDLISNCDYRKDPFYDDMVPIDDSIMREMNSYQGEVLKMMEREPRDYTSVEWRFSDYFTHLKYWNTFLKKASIRLVVALGERPHEQPSFILYRLCCILGIPFISFEVLPFRYKARVLPMENYEAFDYSIKNQINDRIASDVDLTLSEDMQHEFNLQHSCNPVFIRYQVYNRESILRKIKEVLCDGIAFAKHKEDYPINREFFFRISGWIKRKWHKRELWRFYNRYAVEPNYSQKYVYYALSTQPEMSSSPMGGNYVHCYLIAELIAYHLPEGVYLYVKEHPSNFYYKFTTREILHYKRLLEIKKVRLIKMETESLQLIQNSVAVASCTGNVGYEAMFRWKPYMMFGYQIMRYAPYTYNIRSNEDCAKAIRDILSRDIEHDEKPIKAFLDVCEKVSIDVDVNNMDSMEWDNTERNVSVLYEIIKYQVDRMRQ